MPWIHRPALRYGADRDMRMARIVAYKLRQLGFTDAKSYDIRDIGGGRLLPPNLRVADRCVLVRPVGYVLRPDTLDGLYVAQEGARTYVQRGALDLAELVAWLSR